MEWLRQKAASSARRPQARVEDIRADAMGNGHRNNSVCGDVASVSYGMAPRSGQNRGSGRAILPPEERPMPDWTYRTIFRPLLFRLPAARARDITLRASTALAAGSGPIRSLELFGDMRPPAAARVIAGGLDFAGPVGLGAGFDVHAAALPALAQCGFGFLDVGPATRAPIAEGAIERREADEAIWYETPLANDGMDAVAARLARWRAPAIPLGIRVAHRPGTDWQVAGDECIAVAGRLAPYASFLTLDTRAGMMSGWDAEMWPAFLARAAAGIKEMANERPVLLSLPLDLDPAVVNHLVAVGTAQGLGGIVIDDGCWADGGWLVGPQTFAASLRLVRALRAHTDGPLAIIASGGIREPAEALALLDAGATCVQLHSGLVYAGPGLPKRINEAVLATRTPEGRTKPPVIPPGRFLFGWPWIALMGLGILLAGILAWCVAATRVILPYDESFLGLSRDQLTATNDRLLDFMAHDRITFAGAMIALGIVYVQYAAVAMRAGARWAWRAVVASASLGFLGFFLFIGFRYFDPLHAASTAPLFVCFLLGVLRRPRRDAAPTVPDLHNDRRWRFGRGGNCSSSPSASASSSAV
jgi:dihydroorotate dehydrogenase